MNFLIIACKKYFRYGMVYGRTKVAFILAGWMLGKQIKRSNYLIKEASPFKLGWEMNTNVKLELSPYPEKDEVMRNPVFGMAPSSALRFIHSPRIKEVNKRLFSRSMRELFDLKLIPVQANILSSMPTISAFLIQYLRYVHLDNRPTFSRIELDRIRLFFNEYLLLLEFRHKHFGDQLRVQDLDLEGSWKSYLKSCWSTQTIPSLRQYRWLVQSLKNEYEQKVETKANWNLIRQREWALKMDRKIQWLNHQRSFIPQKVNKKVLPIYAQALINIGEALSDETYKPVQSIQDRMDDFIVRLNKIFNY